MTLIIPPWVSMNATMKQWLLASTIRKKSRIFFALIKVNVYYNPVIGNMRHNPTTARRLCLVEKVWAMIFSITFCINEIFIQSPQVMILTWLLLIQQMYFFISTKYHRIHFTARLSPLAQGSFNPLCESHWNIVLKYPHPDGLYWIIQIPSINTFSNVT